MSGNFNLYECASLFCFFCFLFLFLFVCVCFFFNFYPSEATENYYYNEYWSFTDFVTNNSSKHLHIQLEPISDFGLQAD